MTRYNNHKSNKFTISLTAYESNKKQRCTSSSSHKFRRSKSMNTLLIVHHDNDESLLQPRNSFRKYLRRGCKSSNDLTIPVNKLLSFTSDQINTNNNSKWD